MRNSKPHRSKSGRLRAFLVLCTSHDVMISISSLRHPDSDECPPCHLGSNVACQAHSVPNSTHRFRSADQHAKRKLSARHDQLDTLKSTFLLHEERQDWMSIFYLRLQSLSQRILHHSDLFLDFTHCDFNGACDYALRQAFRPPPFQQRASILEQLARARESLASDMT